MIEPARVRWLSLDLDSGKRKRCCEVTYKNRARYFASAQCYVSNRNQSFVLKSKTNVWFLYETQHCWNESTCEDKVNDKDDTSTFIDGVLVFLLLTVNRYLLTEMLKFFCSTYNLWLSILLHIFTTFIMCLFRECI